MRTLKCDFPPAVALTLLAGLTLTVGIVVPGADAATCPGTVLTNFTLSADILTSSTTTCIDVRNGKNVDTNGYSIICQNASGCGPAIDCAQDTAEGSVIQSTVNNDGTHVDIDGPFSIAVRECKTIKNIVIDGSDVAVTNSSKTTVHVQGSVFRDCADVCVDVKMTSNTNGVSDNFIEPLGGDAIRMIGKASGSGGPTVHHNVIRGYATGIYNADATIFRVEDNVLIEGEAGLEAIDVGSGASLTNNVCDDDPDCSCDLHDDGGIDCLAP